LVGVAVGVAVAGVGVAGGATVTATGCAGVAVAAATVGDGARVGVGFGSAEGWPMTKKMVLHTMLSATSKLKMYKMR